MNVMRSWTTVSNIFRNCPITGKGDLPKINEGDLVTLILDTDKKTLSFALNGVRQSLVVTQVLCDVYFVVCCINGYRGEMAVTIV